MLSEQEGSQAENQRRDQKHGQRIAGNPFSIYQDGEEGQKSVQQADYRYHGGARPIAGIDGGLEIEGQREKCFENHQQAAERQWKEECQQVFSIVAFVLEA